MHLRILSYISSIFIIILAIITVFYALNHEKALYKPIKMFPRFADIQHSINKIDIRFPNNNLSLERKKDHWSVTTADNFSANTTMIERLYQDIQNTYLINSKTQHSNNFAKIHLLNPTNTQKINGEGIRITLLTHGNKPYIDFIVGDRLKSYINQSNVRLFTRYGIGGGAYLAQTTTDFQYNPSQFLNPEFGMPKIDEIISMNLIVKDTSWLKLYRVIDNKNPKNIIFMPASMPQDKKLIYPLVMRDYMFALINQLKPIDATYLPLKHFITDVSMALELSRGRFVKINFWHTTNGYYLRIIRDDLETPHNHYMYRIKKTDYETFIQPFDKFLIPDAQK